MASLTPGRREGARRNIDHVTHSRRLAVGACAGCAAAVLMWLLLSAPGAQALCAEVEYQGASNGSWATDANWSGGNLPKSTQTVCVPSGKGTIEVPSGFKAEAKTLTAQSSVKIASTGTLAIAETAKGLGSASTFTGLDLEAGGHLTTVAGWIFLSGGVSIEGEISTSKPAEAVVRLFTGTLVGDGTIDVPFSNIEGTLQPGGVGVVGALHFGAGVSQQAEGTLVLDLKSTSEFDKLEAPVGNVFLAGTLEINLLGGYAPTLPSTWKFLPESSGKTMEFTTYIPTNYRAEGASGDEGAFVELLPPPPTTVTTPASEVTQTSAVLNGTVNPNDTAVEQCEFEYGTSTSYTEKRGCSPNAGDGKSAVAVSAAISGLKAGTTYHFRVVAKNKTGPSDGIDRTFTTQSPSSSGGGSTTSTGGGTSTTALASSIPGAIPVASTPAAVEELLLGCSKSQLVLNDAYIHGSHVVLSGSAAKSLIGKKVTIVFGTGSKQVASATVGSNGQYSTTAPLPPAKIREKLTTRYTAEIGSQRSLHLKLTRRLLLEPPKASGTTVSLSGQVTLPLTKPVTPIVVEQQLECGKTTIVDHVTPPASGRFHITVSVPANARAGIYTLKSKVAANAHATAHGFTTYSLPLPVALG